ncbi:MAG: tyrosine-type recombinase/integrase [Anaerolineae bacterium]
MRPSCSPKTLEHYDYTLGAFARFLATGQIHAVQDITPHHIRAYLVDLQHRRLKDTTQHAHARGIKTWLRWLVTEGDLNASPMTRVRMPRLAKRVPEPFTPEQIQQLLAACPRHTPRGARDYALLLALLDTGLRASELLSLHVGSLDMRSGLCTVLGKGDKQRQVRMGAKARGAVLRMLGHRGDTGAGAPLWLAYDRYGHAQGPLSLSGLQTLLRRLGARAGVTPCGPHRFRRTFALWCLRDGMDLHSLRLLMGHSDLTILQRYLALAGEDIERAHAAHSPADRLLGG